MPNGEADVLEAKEVVGNGAGATAVLARAEKEVVSQDKAVTGSCKPRRGGLCEGQSVRLTDDRQGERLHSCRGRVGFVPSSKEGSKTKIQVAKGIQARVHGPHPGERLCHLAHGFLHCARSHRSIAGGNAPGAVLVGEEEQDWDGVAGEVAEVWTNAVGAAKTEPDARGGGSGGDTMRRVAGT